MKDPIFAGKAPFCEGFHSCEATFWHTSAISQHSDPHFAAAKRLRSIKTPNFAAKAPFRREFRNCETNFWHTSAISQHSDPHFAAANRLRSIKTPNFAAKAPFRRVFCNCKSVAKRKNSQFSQPKPHSAGCFSTAKPLFGTRVPFGSPIHSFRSCKMAAKPQHLKILQRAHHELTCCNRSPIGHISITS